jgi:hypothetical protein
MESRNNDQQHSPPFEDQEEAAPLALECTISTATAEHILADRLQIYNGRNAMNGRSNYKRNKRLVASDGPRAGPAPPSANVASPVGLPTRESVRDSLFDSIKHLLAVKWANYEDKCELEGIYPGVGIQQISPPIPRKTTFSGYKPQGATPAQYYPRLDGVVKLTVCWEFAVVLIGTLSGFLTIFYENNRRAPCLFTQLDLQEDSPVHVSQYKFIGLQQPTPNAVKQAFEKQQKELYDLGTGSALLVRSAQD